MIDLAGPLGTAAIDALKADAGVISAFAGSPVRVFGMAPVNVPTPFLVVSVGEVDPVRADGFNLQEIGATVHVWSLTDPPGSRQAQALGAAAANALLALADAPGVQVYAVELERAQYLSDRDGKTVHGVVALRFTAAPA